MSDYTPEALQQLVKNGIKTIELLQQSPEDFQKTYGRSAIQEPTTRARVQAWESLNTNHDNTSNQDQRSQGAKEGTNTGESKGAPPADGRHGNQSKSVSDDPMIGVQGANHPLWDAKYNDGDSSRYRGDTAGGLPTIGEGSNTFQPGDQEFEGYHPDGPVNAGEYSQISAMDHEMSADEMYGSTIQLTSMRNATTDDFEKVLEEGTPKVHSRLRGITAVVLSPKQVGAVGGPVKKGAQMRIMHRHFWGTYNYPGVVQSTMCTPQCYSNPKRMLMRRMHKAVWYQRPGLLAKVTRLHSVIRRLKESLTWC
nr:W protein [Jeilongvirus sp.]